MRTVLRRQARARLPAMLAALTGLALAPAAARANDRDLRGTPVPAAACVEYNRSASFYGPAWSPDGYYLANGAGASLLLHCALPVNAIDLSGTTNDNDISKFKVYYADPDGFGGNYGVRIQLIKTTPLSPTFKTYVCAWNSDSEGSGSTTPASATKTCAHDIAAGSFYHFDVYLYGNSTSFFGIEFP